MKTKKIVSNLLTAVMLFGAASGVFASEEVHPSVIVDDRVIHFKDQKPIISENNDTLIPVRGVLEAMGATVEWNGENRTVYVKSKDKITRMLFTIDEPIATKYTLKSVTVVDSEDVSLSTAPRILNDRTMIPLRVVSENIGADVDWDQEKKQITIKTKEYQKFVADNTPAVEEGSDITPVYDPKELLPGLCIEADKTTAGVDDEICVSIKLSNADKIKDMKNYGGMSVALFYDSEKLGFVDAKAVINGEEKSTFDANNPEFLNDSVKYIYLVMPEKDKDLIIEDGIVATMTFKVLSEEETEISLSDRVTHLGNDTSLVYVSGEANRTLTIGNATELFIDATPIVINK